MTTRKATSMPKARKPKLLDTLRVQTDTEVVALKKERDKLLSRLGETLETDQRVLSLEARNRELTAKAKALHTRLATAEARANLLAGLKADGTNGPQYTPPRKGTKGNATAILVLSDWHVEELVEADKVAGENAFNLTIARERIERTFQKFLMLLEDARGLASIDEVVVAVIGDLISGYIHEELMEGNQLAPLPATRFAAEHLSLGLDLILRKANVERITIPTCFGNHGRTTPKMRVATAAENSFEQNLYFHLAQQWKHEPRVAWKIEPGLHNWLEVQGKWIRFHHGDAIHYQGGVGGITIPVNKAIAAWDNMRRADLDVFGHWHQFNQHGFKWVSNGCLIGYSPYALRIKAAFQKPTQSFLVVDRANGLTRALPIFCT